MKRFSGRFLAITILLAACVLAILAAPTTKPTLAQGGPSDAIYDKIFADLNTRIGKLFTRSTLMGNYTYDEIVVTDNNLGCPTPGNAAPGQNRAWKVDISVTGVGTYDYRATKDGSIIFLCAGTGLGAPTGVETSTPSAPPPAVIPTATTTFLVATPLPPLPPAPAPAAVPTTYQAPLFAYVGSDGNVRINSLSATAPDTALTNDAFGGYDTGNHVYYSAQKHYTNLRWSKDGTRLLFNEGSALYMAESGKAPVRVASGIESIFGGAWSPDGTEIGFVINSRQPDPNDATGIALLMQVQAVPAAGGQPRVAGTLSYGIECGGGGFGPSLTLLFADTGYGAGSQPFIWTPSGFVHSVNCTGQDGLALSGFDGKNIWLQKQMGRATISPNGAKIAAVQLVVGPQGVQGTGIGVIDVATGAVNLVQAQPNPDRVTWSGDGTVLIYSTVTPGQGVVVTDQGTANAFISVPFTAQSNTLVLWSVPANGGASTQLFTREGFAIGKIEASPTTSIVAFSVIDSEVNLANIINAKGSAAQITANAPRSRVGIAALVPNTPGYPFFLTGSGTQTVFSAAAQFVAVPAAGGAANNVTTPADNPLGLVIGGQAVVPGTGNVNIRRGPGTGTEVLGLVRPGDFVVIVSGPVAADGLRWWEVRRVADGLDGWVADLDTQGIPNLQAVR